LLFICLASTLTSSGAETLECGRTSNKQHGASTGNLA